MPLPGNATSDPSDYMIAHLLALITKVEDQISSLTDNPTSEFFLNKMSQLRELIPSKLSYPGARQFKSLVEQLQKMWEDLRDNVTDSSVANMKQAINQLQEFLKAL